MAAVGASVPDTAAEAALHLLRERVAEAVADAAASAAAARAECPLRHMADYLADRSQQQQQQQQAADPQAPTAATTVAAYEGRHRLAAAADGALSALIAVRPLPRCPRRWLSTHFALAAAAAAERAARAGLGAAERDGRERLHRELGWPSPGLGAGSPGAASESKLAQGEEYGHAAAGRARRGSSIWKAQVAADVRARMRQLRADVERVEEELRGYAKQVPSELAAELREGMLELQQSAVALARSIASATPPAAAGGELSRFGDGIDVNPKRQQRPYRFHEDCSMGGEEEVVPDPPVLAINPSWPSDWQPPQQWEKCTLTVPDGGVALYAEPGTEPAGRAEGGTQLSVLSEKEDWLRVAREGAEQWVQRAAFGSEALTAARLRAALGGLDTLRLSHSAPLACSACAKHEPETQQQAGGAYDDRAPVMLDWLFCLPAQWATANLGDTFGNFQTWKYNTMRFIELGGSRFHPCDIACSDGRHLPRTGGTRTCCVVSNALEVLQRMLAAVDRGFEPMEWPKYAQWDASGRRGKSPEPPPVPAASLAKLSAHDAVEGIFACFMYTYNLQCPNDFNHLRMLQFPGEGPPGWKLNSLCVKSVGKGSRAARAGVRAKDVLVSLGGAEVASDADAARLAEKAATVGVVAARCEPRPLQLFGAVNWAMREAPTAEGVHAELLRRALSVFKPFIWRLDRFIELMDKRPAVLFRGLAKVRTARHYKIGMGLVFAAFTSLSEDAKVAWRFAGEDGGTWLGLQALLALEVAFCSQFSAELELLLGSNTCVDVVDKPTDDVQSTLGTTNDAVSLVQKAKAAAGGAESGATSTEALLRQRIQALRAQQVTFSTFNASYVEPRVQCEDDEAELKLQEAFDDFVASDTQWCVVVGAPGDGKSSALLWLFAQALRALQGDEGRVPLFVSLPLVPRIGEEEGWLRRQVSAQLGLDQTGWAVLARRRMVVFADSADESGAPPEALRERSLAARSELPPGSKGCLSVRDEDMRRMGLKPEDLGGMGCTVLHLQPFGRVERGLFCRRIAERAAGQAAELLKRAKGQDAEGRGTALRELPGCLPPDELLAEMRETALRGDTAKVAALREQFVESAAAQTLQRLERLDRSATESTLLYAMAAEVAQQLEETADAAAVIEASLLRRMRRGATRVDPAAWAAAAAHSAEEHIDALMRVAEALAAALTLNKQWNALVGAAAEAASPLCEVRGGTAVLLSLFPGLPLRTASAEDTKSICALPHRQIQEWLSARWAARAVVRGLGGEGLEVVDALKHWAGTYGVAAAAAERVAEAEMAAAERAVADGAKRGPAMRRALQARIAALDQRAYAHTAELQKLAAQCEELYGADSLTAAALHCFGTAAPAIGIAVLRRALQLRRELLGAAHPDTLDTQYWLGIRLIWDNQPAEAEELLSAARAAHQPGSRGAFQCLVQLARLCQKREGAEQALPLYRAALEGLEGRLGRDHPEVLVALESTALCLEALSRWGEGLALWRRSYLGYRRALPRGHWTTAIAAERYAKALYRSGLEAECDEAGADSPGRGTAAEAVLRAEGKWEQRQKNLGYERRAQLWRYREMGAAGYAAHLRKGQDTEGSREWHMLHFPELLPEVDEQLRRVAEGMEPFDDPEGNAMALYRTGQPADRAAAEALLREAGLWEERQKDLALPREKQLGRYRRMGAEGYAAHLRQGADTAGSRATYMECYPELVPDLDEQLHRVAEGLEPFEDPEGNANALYRTGHSADRAAAEAMLRAAGLWEQRQERVAERRGQLLQLYRQKGAAAYVALLKGEEGDEGKGGVHWEKAKSKRQWCVQNLPEMVMELDEQVRRIAEGLPPFPEEGEEDREKQNEKQTEKQGAAPASQQ